MHKTMVAIPLKIGLCPVAVATFLLFLCVCASRVDPCFGETSEDAIAEPSKQTLKNKQIASTRSERFPSVASRIKLYMSNWYVPTCKDDTDLDGFFRYSYQHVNSDDSHWPTLEVAGLKDHPTVNQTMRIMSNIESIIEPDMLFFVDTDTIVNCANFSYDEEWGLKVRDPLMDRIKFRHNMRMYCQDVEQLLLPAWNHVRLEEGKTNARNEKENDPPPVLIQFGDNKQSHVFKDVQVPHIKKFRSAALAPNDLEAVTSESKTCYPSKGEGIRRPLNSAHGTVRFQPIVWKLATDRHYKKLNDVYRYDTQWSHKNNQAIFRGQLTGSRDGYDKNKSDDENCYNMKRCRLVYNHANSTLIHARLTSTRGRLPDVFNGVELLAPKVKIDTLLGYKGIIMIEGNDVASGLKWALLSQSVVLMPIPKHTSWCMEELLEPWVHYIPLDDFATNVEERMQWVVDNDQEAQLISEQATLWMEDLVFHPDAAEDDRLIQEEILRRYKAHFWMRMRMQTLHW